MSLFSFDNFFPLGVYWFVSRLILFASWALLFAVFAGIGFHLFRCIGAKQKNFFWLVLAFWLGWGGSLVILNLWNFFLPINWAAFVLLMCISVFGWLNAGAGWVSWIRKMPRITQLAALATCVTVSLLVASYAVGRSKVYDTGLYHLQVMRWATTYAVVPGLANLHSRLGFNNSSFLYMALLKGGPWNQIAHHVGSGLLSVVMLLLSVRGLVKILLPPRSVSCGNVFLSLMFLPLCASAWLHASSASPDLPVFLISALVFWLLLLVICPGDSSVSDRCAILHSVTFVAATGITVKLSFIVFGLCSMVAAQALLVVLQRQNGDHSLPWKSWCGIGMAVAVLLPWLVRGIVLSGYPLFPSAVAGIPVDWRVPKDLTDSLRYTVMAWARQPGIAPGFCREEMVHGWTWLRPWLTRSWSDPLVFQYPLYLFGGASVFLVVRQCMPNAGRINSTALCLLLIPFFSAVFWFLSAPDPRFAGHVFWISAAGFVAISVGGLKQDGWVRDTFHGSFAALCVVLLFLAVDSLPRYPVIGSLWGFHPLPIPDVLYRKIDADTGIYVSRNPEKDFRAWDAEIPCAPYFSLRLRLREPGNITAGFMTLSPGSKD